MEMKAAACFSGGGSQLNARAGSRAGAAHGRRTNGGEADGVALLLQLQLLLPEDATRLRLL